MLTPLRLRLGLMRITAKLSNDGAFRLSLGAYALYRNSRWELRGNAEVSLWF